MNSAPLESKENPMVATARKLVDRLRDAGHIAYFAGGCVRDLVRGQPPKDIDIATDARPEEVQEIFKRTYAVGAHFGVIVVLETEMQFEVATFRSDGAYLDGRRPAEVRFSSPEEDARRRDFTINGMFFDPPNDAVIDFVGGRADLAARLIRAIGDPAARFGEDRLRLLRPFVLRPCWRLKSRARPGTHSLGQRTRSARSARNAFVKSWCGFSFRRIAFAVGICSMRAA